MKGMYQKPNVCCKNVNMLPFAIKYKLIYFILSFQNIVKDSAWCKLLTPDPNMFDWTKLTIHYLASRVPKTDCFVELGNTLSMAST